MYKVFKQVIDEPIIWASDCGHLWNDRDKEWLKEAGKTYYRYANLYIGGHKKQSGVHRIIAKAFHGCADEKLTVDHINGVHYDNRPENLRWLTHSENSSDGAAKQTGKGIRFNRTRNARLTRK